MTQGSHYYVCIGKYLINSSNHLDIECTYLMILCNLFAGLAVFVSELGNKTQAPKLTSVERIRIFEAAKAYDIYCLFYLLNKYALSDSAHEF